MRLVSIFAVCLLWTSVATANSMGATSMNVGVVHSLIPGTGPVTFSPSPQIVPAPKTPTTPPSRAMTLEMQSMPKPKAQLKADPVRFSERVRRDPSVAEYQKPLSVQLANLRLAGVGRGPLASRERESRTGPWKLGPTAFRAHTVVARPAARVSKRPHAHILHLAFNR
jgi:hypothetical protein